MEKHSIASITREISEIDAQIDSAIKEQDVDKATQLETRKQMLPRILKQMKSLTPNLEAKVAHAIEAKNRADAAWDRIQAQNVEAKAKIDEIHKGLPNAEEYILAQNSVLGAAHDLERAESELHQLLGQP